MDLNRFPRSIPAAFALTALVLLVLSVGPQVGAFSDNLAASNIPLSSGARVDPGAALHSDLYTPLGTALLERASAGLAGQYAAPENVTGPRYQAAPLLEARTFGLQQVSGSIRF